MKLVYSRQRLAALHSLLLPPATTFVRLALLLVSFASSLSADNVNIPLYATSFEEENFLEQSTTWKSTGTTTVTADFAHTGERSLHLLGDADNSVTFSLAGKQQHAKGLSFVAERWTARAPFEFRVDVQQQGAWRELAKLDRVVRVGKRFLTKIHLVVDGNVPTTAIRFRVVAAPKSGLLIDDFQLYRNPPADPTPIPVEVFPEIPLPLLASETLFKSGTDGVHTYRIPAIITASNGDLIAACDARRKSSADLVHQRTIDIVYRRSTDNGATWSPITVMDPVENGGCSDPSLLLDAVTQDVFCFYNFLPLDPTNREYRFLVQKSSDHGKSWGPPRDITDQVRAPELQHAFIFVTSGRGIQTRSGTLIHNFVHVGHGATLIISNDHGATWKGGGMVTPADESKVVELADGTLMVNSRTTPGSRQVHRSGDQGRTWKSVADVTLPDPQCNACILQYTAKRDGFDKDRLIFCNAASNSGRKNLAVRMSYDGGHHWTEGRVIDPGPAAYSEITPLKDGSFGVLYEPGYGEIRFVRFTLEQLTDGKDTLNQPYIPPTVNKNSQQ
ncbi:MAG: sialidase family protein [Planctomycetaceae bacterium]